MNLTDPIADMLTRIRNALHARHAQVVVPYSKIKEAIARCLEREGFVSAVDVMGTGVKRGIVFTLKYTSDQLPAIIEIHRVSSPGRRVYRSSLALKSVRQGDGVSIVSTPQGVMNDADARRNGVGGEVLLTVW